ncbi:uncharacterized protein MELLADRAFT_85253 [Melampsora larici-populina 98AG31]|uniref:GrpE protein homolog, mitochondrial n=1 Tax=Melampsora larici-populina (strain 98AG31 / pathotype 3-4-7) TaxID=747676 RepID=F4RI30_MELLP|nr:uncharacterized protein MELLADRAFT_85253 [Melampsora larici-populina 98AG31]EGG08029.1 hypothetical protein MELLADRAFT_85253 [Melampsora larici-populina 98AG31]
MASAFRSTRSLQLFTRPRPCRILTPQQLHSYRLNSSTTGESQNASETPLPASENTTTSNPEASQPKSDEQLAKKDAQIAEYKDLYIRARADYENLQKISTREKSQAKDYAIQSFAKDLVSNIDVLKLALDSVPEDFRKQPGSEEAGTSSNQTDSRKHLADLWTGVSSTKTLLEKTLSRFGVTPFDPTGEKFDPNKHEAMFQAPVPGKDPNSVLSCSKVGWMLRDRVLRPAQVGVVQGSD